MMCGTPENLLRDAEALLERRDLARCFSAFDLAEHAGAEPDRCAAGRWMCAMQLGDLETAWLQSDAIRGRAAANTSGLWQGEDIRGRSVMVRCLHGLGDAVQFLRYAPLLRELAANLLVEVPPALLELAPYLNGVEDVITWGEQAPWVEPEWDVQVEVTELPYLFRTQLSDLPVATNYLRCSDSILRCVSPRQNRDTNLRVGIAWAGGAWKPSRSIPLELLVPLMETRGCEFWNLQGQPARQEWAQMPGLREFHDEALSCNTVLRLSALIAQLDLIITPDTLAAHLAGALGVPAWVMLEYAADWRWMHRRPDSPWYPTLRLIRQRVQGDWNGVIETMRKELHRLVHESVPHRLTQRRRIA